MDDEDSRFEPAAGLDGRVASHAGLADFSTDRRVVILSAVAAAIGVIGSLVAFALLWLIAVITNLAFYQRFSALPALPQVNHLGYWVIAVPVVGALIIGLMARFGSDKIPQSLAWKGKASPFGE